MHVAEITKIVYLKDDDDDGNANADGCEERKCWTSTSRDANTRRHRLERCFFFDN
jgi:hypothetical protein